MVKNLLAPAEKPWNLKMSLWAWSWVRQNQLIAAAVIIIINVCLGVMLNQSLSRTEMIYTHGLPLQTMTVELRNKMDKQVLFFLWLITVLE